MIKVNRELLSGGRPKGPIKPLGLVGSVIVRANHLSMTGSKVVYLFPRQSENERRTILRLDVYGLRIPLNGKELLSQLKRVTGRKQAEDLAVYLPEMALAGKSQLPDCEKYFAHGGLEQNIVYQEVDFEVLPHLCQTSFNRYCVEIGSPCDPQQVFPAGYRAIVAIR